jgi:hypothetical protein
MPEPDDQALALMCQIDAKLDGIEATLDYHSQQLDRLELRMAGVDDVLARIEQRLERIEGHLGLTDTPATTL